ncbi:hypothetical protein [Nocardia lijiangensis]|uniref:hypothetical protein n=1 Tax=Nocardia lijiangensis TaxID=299618 RepID=UPI00082B433C|nr:hypothetical protein [Nocardia lijiangensis]
MVTATLILAALGLVRRLFRRDRDAATAEGQERRPVRLDIAAVRRYLRDAVRRPVPALSAAVALLGVGVAVTAGALAEC